jgi:hypothetical protein
LNNPAMQLFDITLPPGATVLTAGAIRLVHLGGGVFRSTREPRLIEGSVVAGSQEAVNWPTYVDIREVEVDDSVAANTLSVTARGVLASEPGGVLQRERAG